jgi:hypothetical protein
MPIPTYTFGGILSIDEAYALKREDNVYDFGDEAIRDSPPRRSNSQATRRPVFLPFATLMPSLFISGKRRQAHIPELHETLSPLLDEFSQNTICHISKPFLAITPKVRIKAQYAH